MKLLQQFKLAILISSFFIFLIVLLNSCNTFDAFEKNVEIPKHEWHHNFQPEVKFVITDTVSTYNVFVTLRHVDAYAYNNIWLYLSTLQPGGSTFQKERLELILQNNEGKWIGTGMSDIFEVRYPIFNNIRFKKIGEYRIRIQQAMRDNPLLHIMNAGIRIEKVKL